MTFGNPRSAHAVDEAQARNYPPEFIYSLKDASQLTDELLLIFEDINEMFKTSSQYIEMKKRINMNIKWKLKRKEEMSPVNVVLNAINRLCTSNFDNIYDEIIKVKIESVADLDKLSTTILLKLCQEEQFLGSYVHLLYKLFHSGHWLVSCEDCITSFRQVIIKKMQDVYACLVSRHVPSTYTDNDRQFCKVVAEMHHQHIISKNLMGKIMNEIRKLYETTKEERFVEYFILLWKKCKDVQDDFITLMQPFLPKRLQFLILDDDEVILDNIDIAKNNIEYQNYITFIEEYNTIQDMLSDVDKNGNMLSFMFAAIRYTIDHPKDIHLITKIIKEGIKLKSWSKNDVTACIDNIMKTEIDEILIDAPYFKNHLETIKKEVLNDKQDKEYKYKKIKNGNKSFQR